MVRTVILIIFILLVTGCSNVLKKESLEEKGLEVILESNALEASLDDTVTFTSKVKYQNETVNNNNLAVEFEVIENGVSYGRLPIEPNDKGEYTLDLKFSEPGEHQIVSHVSYEGLHEMPALSFKITE